MLFLVFVRAFSIGTSSWAAISPVQSEEQAFFRDVEKPQLKPRQKLGRWFVSAESLLWRSALEALSDKSADKLASADDCEMAMWAAARNEGLRQSLNRAFIPLLDTLMIAGLGPTLSAFSVPGKIVIAETLGLTVRLFNRSTFGILETKDIPKEVVRTLVNITAGYTAPFLVDNYLAGTITETALRTSLNTMIDKEELVVSRAEATNQTSKVFSPKHGLPLVKVNVVLVYSPYTHFVTLFIRGVGDRCPGNQLFVLQYEVDKNGLYIKHTLKDRPAINLESLSLQAGVTDRTPVPSPSVCSSRPVPNIRRLDGHTGNMMSVAISHDGTLVASGGFDKSVRLWNASSGAEVARLNVDGDVVSSLAFSPDGRLLARSTYHITPPFTDSSLEIWDVRTRQRVNRLIGHNKWIMSVAFSPDGRLLASGSNDETVRLWDFRSGKELQRLSGHGKGVTTIAFSTDGKLLASASNDQTVRLWDTNSWKEVKRFKVVYPVIAAFSPDGKLATSKKNGEINFLEVSTGRDIRQISLGAEYSLSGITFSSAGRLLAVSDGDGLRLLEVSSGREIWRLVDQRIHRQQLLAFSADGKVIAWGGRDGRVRLWNTTTSGLRQIKVTANPPAFYEDFGACPFEGCTYREWTANKDTIIRQNNSDDSPVAFRARKGEKITGIIGTVLTLRVGCAEVLSPVNVEGIQLAPGAIVHPLRYEGEGFWKIWVQGKTGTVPIGENVELIEYPETVWWVKIRNAQGQIGWSKQPEQLDNKDRFGG